MAFSKKSATVASIDELLEQLGNASAYFTVTGSKTRQATINMIESEIKRRLSEPAELAKKYEEKARQEDEEAERAKRNNKDDFHGKKLTIDVQNRVIFGAWERAKVYREVAKELREAGRSGQNG